MLLYKYRSLEQLGYVLDILANERLFCAPYHQLNDPFEGLFELAMIFPSDDGPIEVFAESDVQDLMSTCYPDEEKAPRVCSLSSDPTDVRLWGHYANSCRGIAIEVDMDEKLTLPVQYLTKLFRHDDAHSYPSPNTVLTRKTVHWEYEKEYRIITEDTYVSVAGRIKKVITGPLCSKESISILNKFVGDALPIVRSKLDRNRLVIEAKVKS